MNRLTLTALLLAFTSSTTAADYYKEPPQFHMHPDPKGARYQLSRLGPVGIGLELIQPAFTMRITGVEAGSSAEATGKLKKGQIIESINGQTLKDVDPRVILGNLITEAEATDGALKMMVKDNPKAAAQEVIVTIPALGVYSDTWPMNCKKSEKIIRNFADFLARVDKPAWGAALFLLSTGEQKDLDVVTRWFKNKLPANKKGYPWEIGYTGPAICEYYLRTGDESVLPAIKSMADHLKATIYNGSWAGRGGAPYRYMAGGHMNAAGVHCVTFLLLAKECGVDVDEHTLQSSLKHFYRYSGHGNVAYGDGLPEGGYVDNGRTGGLAFAMAAWRYWRTLARPGHGPGEGKTPNPIPHVHERTPLDVRACPHPRWRFWMGQRLERQLHHNRPQRRPDVGQLHPDDLHHPSQESPHPRCAQDPVFKILSTAQAALGNGSR